MSASALRDRDHTDPPPSVGSMQRLPGCLMCLQRIASDCLQTIEGNRKLAISGDPEAVHKMRIELRRLRAAALFFAPATDAAAWSRVDHELRWLNSALGRARNRDVAIEYANRKRHRRWVGHSRRILLRSQDKAHRRLAEELGSARYSSLVTELSSCLSKHSSPLSSQTPRFEQTDRYCDERLREWRHEISRRGHHIRALGRKPLHRLRIQSKNYRYMVDALLDLDIPVSREDFLFSETAKRVHQALGDLRDLRQLGKAVERRPPHYRKRKRKLLQRAADSFHRFP